MTQRSLSSLPSVDRLLSTRVCARLIPLYGRSQVTDAIRDVLGSVREQIGSSGGEPPPTEAILATVSDRLASASEPSLRPVLNLTGTVLHTNLGRSVLPAEALDSVVQIASGAANLEYDIDSAKRGDRDTHIESLLTRITGAEAATVVNNNAAAVLLVLNTLALGREVPVSRGELVEIGDSFRVPEIMARAGCKLVEVGATNRTHLNDYAGAINASTALLMKVHTSNYAIEGFTKSVNETDLALLAHEHSLPLVTDLGSGTLIDLTRYGLPFEPTAQAAIESGVDLVTFSGDKLLGGPQAGIIVGKRELIERIRKNPMKRALRVDKMTIAALFEVLKLYRDPDSLALRLPTLRMLTRNADDIRESARAILPALEARLADRAEVTVVPCQSQIGSGSLPTDLLPGYAICVTPTTGDDRALQALARAFRMLPVPVIGRVHDGCLLLDLRTLEDPSALTNQLAQLDLR